MNESVRTDLDPKSFFSYFESNRLGRLYFPNGQCVNSNGVDFKDFEYSKFYIDLKVLGKMLRDFQENIGEIVGVIAFGRAVSYPGTESVVVRKRRKYWVCGKIVSEEELVPIQPTEAELLVISIDDAEGENFVEPVFTDISTRGTWLNKGGASMHSSAD